MGGELSCVVVKKINYQYVGSWMVLTNIKAVIHLKLSFVRLLEMEKCGARNLCFTSRFLEILLKFMFCLVKGTQILLGNSFSQKLI